MKTITVGVETILKVTQRYNTDSKLCGEGKVGVWVHLIREAFEF